MSIDIESMDSAQSEIEARHLLWSFWRSRPTPASVRDKSTCARCSVHRRASRRARLHFCTRRVLIFKAGITVILCLVFIFRRIRRGIFNILLPDAVPPPLATCLNILLEYISQYRWAVRADRDGIRMCFERILCIHLAAHAIARFHA